MKRAFVLGLVLVAGLLYFAIPRAGSATSAPPSAASAAALERSEALATAVTSNRFSAGTAVPAATARAFADGLADDIPLPQGGTFDGIQWEAAGGEFSAAETRSVLQYNAMCQWVRAYRDGRETDVSGQILAAIPSWSSWRDSETAAVLSRAIGELVGGGGDSSAALLTQCDASHEREVRYAEAQGLDSSR
ncbi:hypothetical protein OJ997_00440 [Solirubrobacter phytolaccae]|uniref:Uncharacterized protein n=1 Tax=Solirubrobacter phytolaccae TaxID=1404360 RepID=A0A9X3S740_9ACTN|nr:hypothetical protein [Solirubrobacter phytolaccae]MDA0178746.1 hypothetical protein [Solirubrobacter phytolaccae]